MSDEDAEDIEDADDGDAVGDGEEGAEGSEGRKFSPKKIMLFAGLAILLLILGMAGAYFTGVLDPFLSSESSDEMTGDSASDIAFYDLPEMLVNLNTGGNATTYLKIRVSLEIEDQSIIPKLESLLPRIIDNFQVYLREVRVNDLEGSAGLYRLKEELLSRINTAIQPLIVKDVLFREMLVQ